MFIYHAKPTPFDFEIRAQKMRLFGRGPTRTKITLFLAFLLQPEIRPNVCLLLTSIFLMLSSLFLLQSNFVTLICEFIEYQNSRTDVGDTTSHGEEGLSMETQMYQFTNFLGKVLGCLGLIIFIGAVVLMLKVVIEFRKEREKIKTERESIQRKSVFQMKESIGEYYEKNPLGPAGRIRGITWFNQCEEVKAARLDYSPHKVRHLTKCSNPTFTNFNAALQEKMFNSSQSSINSDLHKQHEFCKDSDYDSPTHLHASNSYHHHQMRRCSAWSNQSFTSKQWKRAPESQYVSRKNSTVTFRDQYSQPASEYKICTDYDDADLMDGVSKNGGRSSDDLDSRSASPKRSPASTLNVPSLHITSEPKISPNAFLQPSNLLAPTRAGSKTFRIRNRHHTDELPPLGEAPRIKQSQSLKHKRNREDSHKNYVTFRDDRDNYKVTGSGYRVESTR